MHLNPKCELDWIKVEKVVMILVFHFFSKNLLKKQFLLHTLVYQIEEGVGIQGGWALCPIFNRRGVGIEGGAHFVQKMG